ncbi:MAG: hypothetical protein QOE90_2149 [Thermoplasmata archaeon]|jgi:hypothetical protein|nr:hypothetical protein [Thermoplasmata archaeon]
MPGAMAPTALDDPTWTERAAGLIRELQRAHADAFRRVLEAESRARAADPPQKRDARRRSAQADLAEAFAHGLQARLLDARDALAACGVQRDRFDEMVDGGWDLETFPFLWVDLHAMLRELDEAGPVMSG